MSNDKVEATGYVPRRPWTLTVRRESGETYTVKRCCNGCGRPIGDASEADLDAAMTGAPLPDVVDECGCEANGDLSLPPGCHQDDQSTPELGAAVERARGFLSNFGDGIIAGPGVMGDVVDGPPLYARDLMALIAHAEALLTYPRKIASGLP